MRINQFIAQATGLSRRAADSAIQAGRVMLNGKLPETGYAVKAGDKLTLDGRPIIRLRRINMTTIMLNKPSGYICSRNGQGSKTVYDLLPPKLHNLKPVGRLDKDSSGLLLMTDDGELANQLTHPRYKKEKVYEVELDRPLEQKDKVKLESGVMLQDGKSRLQVTGYRLQKKSTINSNLQPLTYEVTMSEGRNRQIRRTFSALGYKVKSLHRIRLGPYILDHLSSGQYKSMLLTQLE